MLPEDTDTPVAFGTSLSVEQRMAALAADGTDAIVGVPATADPDDLSDLQALGGRRAGFRLSDDPTAPVQLLDPTVGTGGAGGNPGVTTYLNLADSQPTDEDTTTVGDEGSDALPAGKVRCPQCGTLVDENATTCPECGYRFDQHRQTVPDTSPVTTTGYSQSDLATSILHLSTDVIDRLQLANTSQRKQWASKGLALPDGSWPIPDVGYLKKAIQAFPGRAQGQEGKIKAWILKRAKALGYTGEDLDKVEQYGGSSDTDDKGKSTNASQPEHAATLAALSLDHTAGDNGLIWKVLCKTGTLALSPGPGQADVDKPLNLTADMFQAVKSAYDDRAFEHVTIPETHGNGTLENTGTVDALEVLTQPQALADARLSQSSQDAFRADPADTLYLLGGMRFTDPKVKEKAANGSILNCSVGLKFNYRRKRDGKLYPVALEHTALTNQPWVDGLGAFSGPQLSQPFDQAQLPVWDGVFVQPPATGAEPEVPQDVAPSSQSSLSASGEPISLPSTMADDATTPTLEELLARQTAQIEQLQSQLTERDQAMGLSQQQLTDQGRQLHVSRTNERVAELQGLGVPPAVLKRYKELRLAAYEAEVNGADTLQLSVKDGDSTVTKEFGPVEQAEYLLAAIPLGDPKNNVVAITRGIAGEALALSQQSAERVELSAEQKADAIEKQMHPERFDADGKRKQKGAA